MQEDDTVLQEGMENSHFVQTIIINIVKVCPTTESLNTQSVEHLV